VEPGGEVPPGHPTRTPQRCWTSSASEEHEGCRWSVFTAVVQPQLFLMAYGKLYSNRGAMTPGSPGRPWTACRWRRSGDHRRAARRALPVAAGEAVYIEKKNSSKKRPLGLPTWSDKLVAEVVRLLLEAYYEPQFSDRSTGSALAGAATPRSARWWTSGRGRTGSSRATSPTASGRLTMRSCLRPWRRRSTMAGSCNWSAGCSRRATWRTGHGTPRSAAQRKVASPRRPQQRLP